MFLAKLGKAREARAKVSTQLFKCNLAGGQSMDYDRYER